MKTQPNSWFFHYMPLLAAIVSYALMVIARLLTNDKVKKYHEKIAVESLRKMSSSNDPDRMTKRYEEVAKAVCENPPVGEIPVIYS